MIPTKSDTTVYSLPLDEITELLRTTSPDDGPRRKASLKSDRLGLREPAPLPNRHAE
jgi:hypothetical protein